MSNSRTCKSCSCPLPEQLTYGVCPSCGSAQAGLETQKASDTPERDDDFVVGFANQATRTLSPETALPSTIIAEPGVSARPSPRTPPELFGYREVVWISHGGMGDVYRGIQTGTERTVAIKVMRPGGSSHSQSRERFENEIRALARVDHPGVVRVYECGECSHGPYFSMEFVEGETLSKRVKREGPLPPNEAVRIVRQAAEAVHCAHCVDVLHRDIKPSNIMIAPDGTVKVTDFGLAKHIDDTEELTQTGVVIGTPSYIPPEQATGNIAKIGLASDVYGLGGTLYDLLTGFPPHTTAATPARTIRQALLNDVVPPKKRRPDLCPILNAIVEKSLAREPKDRYDSAERFANELSNWASGQPTIAVPPTRWQSAMRYASQHRVAVALLILVPLLLVAGAIVRWQMDPKGRIERALARGETVTLVGETGKPKWHDWVAKPSQLEESLMNDETWGFSSRPFTGLVLVEDPQTEHYRFRAEFRHIGGLKPLPGALTTNPTAKIGLFWGAQKSTTQGSSVHLMFSIDFNDLTLKTPSDPKADEAGHRVGIHVNCFLEQPNAEIRNSESGMSQLHVFRAADNAPPGYWRTIEIEVRPTGCAVFWRKIADGTMLKIGSFGKNELNEMLQGRSDYLAATPPGNWTALAVWSPRQPLGIFAINSTVAIRNVTVEPLPPSP